MERWRGLWAGVAGVEARGSPSALARLTGALYLYIIAAAMFAEVFVRQRLIVSGDPAATARNIAASEGLWRWAVAANVTTTVCDVAVAALLFVLLRPAGRTAAVCATAFRLAYSAAMAVGAAFLAAPLALVAPAPGGSPADAAQAAALVSYSLRLHGAVFDVALVLFGAHLALVGGLIARSGFLPRWLGAALGIAGACYVVNSLAGFVAPELASRLFPWILLPPFLAEVALALRLLILGVDPQRWAGASSRPPIER